MKHEFIFFCIVFLSICSILSLCEEPTYEITYGIKKGDSIISVRNQAKLNGFEIVEKPVLTESGEELGLFLYRENELILTVVIYNEQVHWIDVNEKGANINGIIVGSDLSGYQGDGFKMEFLGHRDSTLDDVICLINDVKVLIDYSMWKTIREFLETDNVELLKKLKIKGIWL
jgi:hypothetical protein